jgi:predicted ABC-type sugar transport system permease subunit
MNYHPPSELALNSTWFPTPEVTFPYLGMHNFPVAGNMEAARRSFMCLKLGHLELPEIPSLPS